MWQAGSETIQHNHLLGDDPTKFHILTPEQTPKLMVRQWRGREPPEPQQSSNVFQERTRSNTKEHAFIILSSHRVDPMHLTRVLVHTRHT